MTLQITESARSDISTVYAYFLILDESKRYPNGQYMMCDSWSLFNSDYAYGKEREFIAEIEAKNPGKYSSYHIGWSDCN